MEWKKVKGYENEYEISNKGYIRSIDREVFCKNGRKRFFKGRELEFKTKSNGYKFIVLYKNGVGKNFYAHRLVICNFNSESELEVNHKDGNKTNNDIRNLEYCTHSENLKHAYKNGLKKKGEEHKQAKLSENDVVFIRENYKPNHEQYGAKSLSILFGVSKATISRIANNKRRV